MQRDQSLESLNKFVGTWKATDPTGRGGISGQTRFEWMKGGKVLLQWVEFGGATGLEVIAYDKESQSLKSHYFDASGGILEYVYAIDGDDITIRIDMKGREGAFTGRFAPDGNSMSGEWNWTESGKRHHYAARLERIAP